MYGACVKIVPSCWAGILINIVTAKKANIEYFHALAIESSSQNGQIFLGRAKGTIRAIAINEIIIKKSVCDIKYRDLKELKLMTSRIINTIIGVMIMLRPHVSFTGNISTQYFTLLLNFDFNQSPNLHAHSDIVPT